MKYRLVTLISFLVTVTAIAITTHHLNFGYSNKPTVRAPLPAKASGYLGVYEPGSPPRFEPVAGFSAVASRLPNLVGYYSGWAEPFKMSFAELMHKHGVTPFVQIDPRFASVSAIASGVYDDYLRSYADSVRDYGHPVVIGFGHEMNGDWYPWGFHHVDPATFVAAWRHIVTLFAAQGAQNVTWLWTIDQDRPGTGPIRSWWPGDKYVTWVGIDGYYVRPSDTFSNVFGQTIQQVQAFTRRPILLSETAVAPRANQFIKIADLFAGMQKYKTLGLVWFDKDQQGSLYNQNWRLEGKVAVDAEFQLSVSKMR